MRSTISKSVLGALVEAEVPVPFWKFATPILVGGVAARGASYLVKQAFAGSSARTQETAHVVTGIAVFWLVAGGTWIALSPKRSA